MRPKTIAEDRVNITEGTQHSEKTKLTTDLQNISPTVENAEINCLLLTFKYALKTARV